MSNEEKQRISIRFAEQAAQLAQVAKGIPPVLYLAPSAEQDRETSEHCPLSADAGRMAVFAMTFCNPLALKAATVIEGTVSS